LRSKQTAILFRNPYEYVIEYCLPEKALIRKSAHFAAQLTQKYVGWPFFAGQRAGFPSKEL